MSTAQSSRIDFLRDTNSWAGISREVGVSVYRLQKVSDGVYSLAGSEAKQLSNFYYRDAYSRLRESGATSANASRFAYYRPQKVSLAISYNLAMVETRMLGWIAANEKRNPGDELTSQMLVNAYNAITESFAKNRKDSAQNWEKYLGKWAVDAFNEL